MGICGSDLHFYHEGHIGDKVVERPFVLGHEAAGDVVEVGAEVTDSTWATGVLPRAGHSLSRLRLL